MDKLSNDMFQIMFSTYLNYINIIFIKDERVRIRN
jgi:hypothetical protein